MELDYNGLQLSSNSCYLQNSHIQVAICDDRLEIISPSGFMSGVTLYKIKEGYSKNRKCVLIHAFSYIKLIEVWGSGIPKRMEACGNMDCVNQSLLAARLI